MKSTLFASTLAAALTGTSFGQVEVELLYDCCDTDTGQPSWTHTYVDEILTFDTTNNYGLTRWAIQVPETTVVSFNLSWNTQFGPPTISDVFNGQDTPFASMIDSWNAQGSPSFWTDAFVLPAGSYEVDFFEFEGVIDFDFEIEAQGSCCVSSGCTSNSESNCTELGGTWTEGGSCDDCESVADDCPADVDGDGSIGFSDVLIILNDWGACP